MSPSSWGSRSLLILILAIVTFRLIVVADGAPTGDSATKTDKLEQLNNSPKDLERLRAMFLGSQLQAIQNYQQRQALAHLNQGNSSSQDQSQVLKDQSIHVVPLSALPALSTDGGNSSAHQFILYQSLRANASGQESNSDDKDDDRLAKLVSHDANFKNDARQSSLFPGLVSSNFGNSFGVGGGNTNPLMNGALFRQPMVPTPMRMPHLSSSPFGSLTTLTLTGQRPQQQQQPRPKSSIIGNTGGSMALTNDNVVVVNVLSGNY